MCPQPAPAKTYPTTDQTRKTQAGLLLSDLDFRPTPPKTVQRDQIRIAEHGLGSVAQQDQIRRGENPIVAQLPLLLVDMRLL